VTLRIEIDLNGFLRREFNVATQLLENLFFAFVRFQIFFRYWGFGRFLLPEYR